jgi:hypothetical protein
MQANFFPPGVGAGRPPMHHHHRPHPSLVFAPGAVPMTPLPLQTPFTPAFPPGAPYGLHHNGVGAGPQGLVGPQPPQSAHPSRRGRQPSVSVGGPPKAALGGAGKNYRPPSPSSLAAQAAAAAVVAKVKKTTVLLPKETIVVEEEDNEDGGANQVEEGQKIKGKKVTRPVWARTPLRPEEVPPQLDLPPPTISSGEIYPLDLWRRQIPETVDVFLPGKVCLFIFNSYALSCEC